MDQPRERQSAGPRLPLSGEKDKINFMATVESLDTPLMRQYQSIKSAYPHALLFFRLGDFYEMFGEDARAASPVLGLVLTARQGVPMCGVPVHSASNYIAKLLKSGFKVAIAEQMEDPAQAKGLVKRQVVRLITPGTIVEENLLDAKAANYLVALEAEGPRWGLACLEVSTGEFWATQTSEDPKHRELLSLLARLDPAELLVSYAAADQLKLTALLDPKISLTFYDTQKSPNAPAWSREEIWASHPFASNAALKVAQYLSETQTHLHNTLSPRYAETQGDMQLDESAIRTLELVKSSVNERQFSLWGILDRCQTAMGSRKLRTWILRPSTHLAEIERRQEVVEELLKKIDLSRGLSGILDNFSDLERLVIRLSTRSASPRDLTSLRNSLGRLDELFAWFSNAEFGPGLEALSSTFRQTLPPLKEIQKLLESALAENPPTKLQDGGIFRKGYDPVLDELHALKDDSRRFLGELEAKERLETGIGSLKVAFNSVYGYYIEVTKTHLAKVPPRFQRKQTLTNAERFVTPELQELEGRILGAEDRLLKLEIELFDRLRTKVLEGHAPLLRFAALIGELDALKSLAEVACSNDWVRPRVDESHQLIIEDGRHPVVEAALPAGAFTPNSLRLDSRACQILLLTGPNMGGKSTYLRQSAIIAILAQMGSFVPAKSATVGIVDRILTRIGAQDILSRNESTFMVEMRETAHILQSATPRSLIVLDEVGRGTSTFDGISIAWAVLEHLQAAYQSREPNAPRGPRTLFATHYFELTELPSSLPGIQNSNVEAREWKNAEGKTEVVFLHRISPGPADRSFGIHVAQLAGLPESCLSRAREILKSLESESKRMQEATSLSHPPSPAGQEPQPTRHPVLEEMAKLRPEDITPIEALNLISTWKNQL